MITVVDKLPDDVPMSQYYKDKVRARRHGKKTLRYIEIMHGGHKFYIPITKEVWEAFSLNNQLLNQDGEVCWENGKISEALSHIVGSVLLQVRDQVLAGLGQEIIQEVHDRIDKVMCRPLMKRLEEGAKQRMDTLLVEAKEVTDGQV